MTSGKPLEAVKIVLNVCQQRYFGWESRQPQWQECVFHDKTFRSFTAQTLTHFHLLQVTSTRPATQDQVHRWLLGTNPGGRRKAQLPFQFYENAVGRATRLMAQREETDIACFYCTDHEDDYHAQQMDQKSHTFDKDSSSQAPQFMLPRIRDRVKWCQILSVAT